MLDMMTCIFIFFIVAKKRIELSCKDALLIINYGYFNFFFYCVGAVVIFKNKLYTVTSTEEKKQQKRGWLTNHFTTRFNILFFTKIVFKIFLPSVCLMILGSLIAFFCINSLFSSFIALIKDLVFPFT